MATTRKQGVENPKKVRPKYDSIFFRSIFVCFFVTISSSSHQHNMPETVGTNKAKKVKTVAPSEGPAKAPSKDPPSHPPSIEPSTPIETPAKPSATSTKSSEMITPDGSTAGDDKPPAFVGCTEGGKEELGDVPHELFSKNVADNLSKAMKVEVMNVASLSRGLRQDPAPYDSSDDEEYDVASVPRSNIVMSPESGPRIGNRNEIYGMEFGCPYVVAAWMGKNGPFTDEKIYDKEWATDLIQSVWERTKIGIEGFKDMTLKCNRLQIHSVKLMRNRHENRAKTFRYTNGGVGYYYVFIKLFSKSEVKAGLNNEEVLLNWLKAIRDDFCATRARFTFRLEIGGLIGRSEARYRALDTLLLDSDVAEYARMFYGRKINNGTMLKDPKRVAQFYSVWNHTAARDLLS